MCAAAGLSTDTFYSRIAAGWSPLEALFEPRRHDKRPPAPITAGAGITLGTYYERLGRGWSKEEALQTPFRQLPERLRQQGARNRYHRLRDCP